MKEKKIVKILFLLLFTGFLTACASLGKSSQEQKLAFAPDEYIPQDFIWQQVAPGIEKFYFENPAFPLVYHIVRIDLTQKNLELVCFPDEGTKKSDTGIFTGQRTASFAKKYNCAVALNASPFEGRLIKKRIVGLHLYNNTVFSPANPYYSSIVFMKNKTDSGQGYIARILESQNEEMPAEITFAFGGFFTILKDDQFIDSYALNNDSRNGVGLSPDGKTLYVLTVEGERHSRSIGLSYPQCARIFKALGCSDAMELDGGGSTELCIMGKSILNYTVFRITANSFGFIIKGAE